jgi:hypothetical protein
MLTVVGIPDLGPLTGPLTSFPTLPDPKDAFPFPSHSLRQSVPYSAGASSQHNSNPDFFALLSQAEASTSSRPSHPPTPNHPYYNSRPTTSHRGQDGRAIKRQSISTSTDSSLQPTPLNSAFPSPTARLESMTPRIFDHGFQNITPTDQGSGSANEDGSAQTPGAEADSEDKRTRNTLACESLVYDPQAEEMKLI